MACCSSFQPVVVYDFREIKSTFSVPSLKLGGRLLIAPWHGFHLFDKEIKMRLIPLHEGFLLDLLIFLYTCCNLCLLFKISCWDNKFLYLTVFLLFLHQFVWKHFRIFVTVMWSKFNFLSKFSTRGNLKWILFCHEAFYFVMWHV